MKPSSDQWYRDFRQALGAGLRGWENPVPNEIYFEIGPEELITAASFLDNNLKAPLVTMIGTDQRALDQTYKLYYVFSLPGRDLFAILKVVIEEDKPYFPSITPRVNAAHWYEREVKDLLGLQPIGHPEPRPLVLHGDWPKGIYPLRKDFDPVIKPGRVERTTVPHRVEGEGVFQIPVGPIHAGIIEPGHFRFSAVGDTVLHLEAKLFYTHKGIEKLCEGMDFERGLLIAERICGVCSFSHSTAYCQAIERIAGIEVSDRVNYLRTVFLEMERLYNHIGDVGNICAGVGFHFGISQGGRLKEELMLLNERIAGNRYLRGLNFVGGLARDLTGGEIEDILKTIQKVGREFTGIVEILLTTDSLKDRIETTGILPQKTALDLGVVGPAARASGIKTDLRREHPFAAYGQMKFDIPFYPQGDVAARLKVRIDEAYESANIIIQALENLPTGALLEKIGELQPYSYALGYTESPRGSNIHWLMTGPGNTIYRYRIRSASYCNWPAVPLVVPGNIVPDFPLINKSFELCYSCLDR